MTWRTCWWNNGLLTASIQSGVPVTWCCVVSSTCYLSVSQQCMKFVLEAERQQWLCCFNKPCGLIKATIHLYWKLAFYIIVKEPIRLILPWFQLSTSFVLFLEMTRKKHQQLELKLKKKKKIVGSYWPISPRFHRTVYTFVQVLVWSTLKNGPSQTESWSQNIEKLDLDF